MIYLVADDVHNEGHPLRLEAIVEIAKPAGIPVLVDAAAENLTIPYIHLERGADVVAYSGGKAICGPQGAGLAVGQQGHSDGGLAGQFAPSWAQPGQQDRSGRDLGHAGCGRSLDDSGPRGRVADLAVAGWIISRDGCRRSPVWRRSIEQPAGPSNHSPTLGHRLGSGGAAHHRRAGGRGFRPQQTAHRRGQQRWRAAGPASTSRPARCSRARRKSSPSGSSAFSPRIAVHCRHN